MYSFQMIIAIIALTGNKLRYITSIILSIKVGFNLEFRTWTQGRLQRQIYSINLIHMQFFAVNFY